MGLDGVAGGKEFILVACLGSGDGFVEEGVHFCGKCVLEGVEFLGEMILVEVEVGQVAADAFQALADFADFLHVHFHFDAEFLAEHIDKLDGGSCRAFAKPPDVGVEDVHAVEDGHQG